MSTTFGGQVVPLTKRYAIRLAFLLCCLLSVKPYRRYLKRNLWLVAVAYPLAHTLPLAFAAATSTKDQVADREIELYS